MQTNDRISQLHQAVNEIREIKAQIKNLHTKFDDDPKLKGALEMADAMEKKMSEVEQQLIQVNMKGSEGNLAFPSMLNERFDHSVMRSNQPTLSPLIRNSTLFRN